MTPDRISVHSKNLLLIFRILTILRNMPMMFCTEALYPFNIRDPAVQKTWLTVCAANMSFGSFFIPLIESATMAPREQTLPRTISFTRIAASFLVTIQRPLKSYHSQNQHLCTAIYFIILLPFFLAYGNLFQSKNRISFRISCLCFLISSLTSLDKVCILIQNTAALIDQIHCPADSRAGKLVAVLLSLTELIFRFLCPI